MKRLKTVINKLSDVPDNERAFYIATKDNKWELALDGDVPGYIHAERLDEFRKNNRQLHRQVSDRDTEIAALKTQLHAKETTAMALKPFVTSDELAALPKALHALYVERDGQHVLDIEGGLVEVNDLKTKLDEYRTKYADIDIDAYKTSAARITELETQLAAATTATDTAVFRSKVADAFLHAGGRPEALDFIITKAKDVFTLQDGQLSTKEFSAERPGEALSLIEWVGARGMDSAFAFLPSSGGGANPKRSINRNQPRTISSDPVEFGRHIEAIAKGEITVSS